MYIHLYLSMMMIIMQKGNKNRKKRLADFHFELNSNLKSRQHHGLVKTVSRVLRKEKTREKRKVN